MSALKCPVCGQRKIVQKTIRNYDAQLGGIPFVVDEANVAECEACGESIFAASEIKRWEQELRRQLQEKGQLLTPAATRELREELGLSVSDMARLLGITRQTVYAWEHASAGLQLGPAALLLALLKGDLNAGRSDVLAFLVQAGQNRGQDISVKIQATRLNTTADERTDPCALTRDVPSGAPAFACTV